MTLPPNQPLSKTADQRLNVMLTLDNLGAGFNLASHDLDIRGAGNLLGDEQSGHIKEVGIELYQHMLEEAVAAAKAGEGIDDDYEEHWSPQINLGVSILIPERYITDLSLRLKMYKRIAGLETIEDVQDIRIELIDRFGNLPEEIENLLQVIHIKVLCRQANIQKIDAGPKAAVVSFKGASFPNPEGLIQFISKKAGLVKVKADHRLVYMRAFPKAKERMDGVRAFVAELAKIAQK
jgi:transcription-repair coupling factor (superfamily II helicase)